MAPVMGWEKKALVMALAKATVMTRAKAQVPAQNLSACCVVMVTPVCAIIPSDNFNQQNLVVVCTAYSTRM